MINTKNNTLEKLKNITQIVDCVKHLRYFFFFYAFISFVFWFLNCFEVDWLYLFNWLFLIPYKIVIMFYRPEGIGADFTLTIIGGISLALGFAVDYGSNYMYRRIFLLQEKEEARIRQTRLKKQKKINKPVPGSSFASDINAPLENLPSSLLFIIMPHISKIGDNESGINLTFQEVEIWNQRVNKKLLENFNYSKPLQKGYYRKKLFLVYKDFNFVDDFIFYLKPTLLSVTNEFKQYDINVTFGHVLSSISQMNNLEKELDCMDTILSLGFDSELIATYNFQITYENKQVKGYQLIQKGEYNLSKNLTITNRQPLYLIQGSKK